MYNDPDDDIFVYAALAAQAPVIVSGDGHLQQMGQVMGVHVLTPRELIRLADLLEKDKKPSMKRFPRHPRLLQSASRRKGNTG